MAIKVRDLNLDADRSEAIRFLYENLTPHSNASRFEWLYLRNPHGKARAWIALDEGSQPIGFAAAFPRCLSMEGRLERAWVLGDFCVAKEHRSLGPALLLQRACLDSLASSESNVWYDFPSNHMLAVYRRMGIPVLGTQVRYAKLVRTDEQFQRRVPQKHVAAVLSRMGNLVLALRTSRPISAGDIEFCMQQGPFTPEFDVMHGQNGGAHPIQGHRSAEYLNWRFVNHPQKQYCAVVARRRSQLAGYGIIEIDDTRAVIADLYTVDDAGILPGLLAFAEDVVRDLEVCTISAHFFEHCHLVPYLRHAGFLPRETSPVVAHAIDNTGCSADVRDPRSWIFFGGDRDS